MKQNRTHKLMLAAVAALLLVAVAAPTALAHGNGHGKGHGKHWFHGWADRDRDGASYRCERQTGTNPRVADTDGNGTVDGLENPDGDGANNAAESRLGTNCAVANDRFKVHGAKIAAFSDNMLTLAIGKRGGLLTAPLAADVDCVKYVYQEGATTSRKARSSHGRKGSKRGRHGHRGHGKGDRGSWTSAACAAADLTEGAYVKKAKVKNGEFTKIRLVAKAQ